MLRCSSAALSKNTVVAAAIARPARTRCQRGHRERKRSCVARVSTVGARGSTRADFFLNKYVYTSSCSFYSSSKKYTWLDYKKPQIQAPGTTFSNFSDEFGMEVTETAVALPYSRECTKEPISALPNYALKEKFGARAA